MAKNIDEIVASLDTAFSSGPPTDAKVRGQTVSFYPDQWNKRWPASLVKPHDVRDSREKLRVSREDLLKGSATLESDAERVAFMWRVFAWGSGTSARSTARCAKALSSPEFAPALARSYEKVRAGNILDAYRALLPRGSDRIKYLGAAFFTKWLYFIGYERSVDGNSSLTSLILDARVARSLGWYGYGWSTDDYRRYLQKAREIQEKWCPTQPLHVVEYALFIAGAKQR